MSSPWLRLDQRGADSTRWPQPGAFEHFCKVAFRKHVRAEWLPHDPAADVIDGYRKDEGRLAPDVDHAHGRPGCRLDLFGRLSPVDRVVLDDDRAIGRDVARRELEQRGSTALVRQVHEVAAEDDRL